MAAPSLHTRRDLSSRPDNAPRLAGDAPLSEYSANGFAVVKGILDAGEVDQLRAEAAAVCRGSRGFIDGMPAVDDGDTDAEVIRRVLALDNPHKVSALMFDALRHPRVVEVLVSLVGPDIKAMQSMLFIKSRGRPGQAWHQDELFIPTRDRSLTAAWIALDDATIGNGCLWAIPGSHRPGVLYPDRPQDDPRFDCSDEAFGFPYTDDDAVAIEVPAGGVVFFNGYLLHRSLPNVSGDLRRALVNHYMSAQSLLPWRKLPPGTHIGEHDYRDIVLVAGVDPYVSKGTVDLSRAEIRPDGNGGCGR
jgi:ectoine hydroxylase-related dioxygenase (phytanoyl-CoA dioxygenase family)